MADSDPAELLWAEFDAGLGRAILGARPGDLEAMEMLGAALTRLGRHHEALQVDRALAGLVPTSPTARYNLACSLSNLNRIDEALRELESALALGFHDLEHMSRDPDLANVRRDPRFGRLVGGRGR